MVPMRTRQPSLLVRALERMGNSPSICVRGARAIFFLHAQLQARADRELAIEVPIANGHVSMCSNLHMNIYMHVHACTGCQRSRRPRAQYAQASDGDRYRELDAMRGRWPGSLSQIDTNNFDHECTCTCVTRTGSAIERQLVRHMASLDNRELSPTPRAHLHVIRSIQASAQCGGAMRGDEVTVAPLQVNEFQSRCDIVQSAGEES